MFENVINHESNNYSEKEANKNGAYSSSDLFFKSEKEKEIKNYENQGIKSE